MHADQKASHLLLHLNDVARKVRLTEGKDVIGNLGGVEAILKILRRRFAPDMADCIFQGVSKFMHSKRTTYDADSFLLEFEMLRLLNKC